MNDKKVIKFIIAHHYFDDGTPVHKNPKKRTKYYREYNVKTICVRLKICLTKS